MVAKRQHTRPILVRDTQKGGTAQALERIGLRAGKGSAGKETYHLRWLPDGDLKMNFGQS